MVCEELHYSSLVLNANSKEKKNVPDSMKETSSLKGTKPTATKISQVKMVSILKRTRIFMALWLRNKLFPYIMSPITVLYRL